MKTSFIKKKKKNEVIYKISHRDIQANAGHISVKNLIISCIFNKVCYNI